MEFWMGEMMEYRWNDRPLTPSPRTSKLHFPLKPPLQKTSPFISQYAVKR